jgi:hypothetical protein
MDRHSTREKLQARLDDLTRRWWLYPLLLLLFMIPAYTDRGYDPRGSMDLIAAVLSRPLIASFPVLFPIAKAIPVLLIAGAFGLGNRLRSLFNVYAALLHLALALLQTTAVTEQYGFAVITGNLALILVVALLWIWEVFSGRNDFEPRGRPLWRWWVMPLAAVALLAPLNTSTMSPDFRLATLLANESGLTYCMMTPAFLAVLILLYPRVNLALLRVASFVGMCFAAMNMLTWFVVTPSGWWMGVLHIPLAVTSLYAFVLSQRKIAGRRAEEKRS